MRFLVTGGAGFIGSHITERLLKDGHFVRVLDNFSSGKRENLNSVIASPETPSVIASPEGAKQSNTSNKFELLEGDIRDFPTCLRATDSIDYVFHEAALRSVPASLHDPLSYNDVNINGTLFMLQASAKNKIKRFVLASSSSVYGDVDKFPESEEMLPELISPYALSKLAGEYYCRIFSQHFGLETVCLRYFNVFGPRQALDDEYAVVIPKFITCILNDEPPPIFGTGKQSRDFCYIDNIVQANILAATRHCEEPRNLSRHCEEPRRGDEAISKRPAFHGVFNVANGKDNTILELVGLINKILGKNVKPKLLPIRAGDVFRTLADISKIQTKLGYKPVCNFEEGLRRTVEWFSKQYSLTANR